jgi:hypothetical protein
MVVLCMAGVDGAVAPKIQTENTRSRTRSATAQPFQLGAEGFDAGVEAERRRRVLRSIMVEPALFAWLAAAAAVSNAVLNDVVVPALAALALERIAAVLFAARDALPLGSARPSESFAHHAPSIFGTAPVA